MVRTIEMAWMLAQGSSGRGGVLEFLGLTPTMLLIIVVGLVVAIGAWWLVKFIYKHREKAKELTLVRRMFASTSGGPAAGADPAKRAAIDNMRRSFEEGVEKFRAAGKNVYTLPWVLLAGPSGSGKTEAIRHCNVGFPPGLQNYLQGAGGTLNMHWWFTNDAVILDTAGRIFMESASQGGGDEWRELLKMLKDVRPLCPVNGMLLCIGVDSLIKDSGDDIQEKAGKIAQQLDTIQRVLDVRFPVFVVVTKCDLITGFREFFESVTDPALQHQMMGWSNPAALDTVFNPEQVSEHIESVRQRLLRRRYALTIDPIHTDDPQARRTDQVDALYALPDSLARLSSRLRRYLELIFVQGEWSPKPLFLRGIYFTSSMRQGAELDEELAKMLGVSVDKLPGGATEEKSYFLRDVFKEKVFKEKGLVTRATNVDKQQARQRLMVVGSAIAAAVLLLACTLYSSWDFRSRVQEPTTTWETLQAQQAKLRVVSIPSGGAPVYPTDKIDFSGLDARTRADAMTRARQLAETPPSVPLLLKPMSALNLLVGGNVASDSRKAAASLVVRSAVAPLVEQARQKLAKEPADGSTWSDEASVVLAGLIRIDRGEKGVVGQRPIDADALLKYVLPPDQYKLAQGESKQLQELVTWAYDSEGGKAEWTGKPEAALTLGSNPDAVKIGVAAFNAHWGNIVGTKNGPLAKLQELQASAAAFEQAEKNLRAHSTGIVKSLQEGENSYTSFETAWKPDFEVVSKSKDALNAACLAAGFSGNSAELEKSITAAKEKVLNQASAAYAQVLDEPAPETGGGFNLPTGVSSKADQAVNQAKKAEENLGKVGDALGLNSKDWADSMKDRQKELRGAREKLQTVIGEQIEKMRVELNKACAGNGVLAHPSDKFEFEKRFGAYSAASGAVAASKAPEAGKGPKWGELGVGEAERAKPFGSASDAIKKDYPEAKGDGQDAGSYSLGVVTLAQRAARTRAILTALEGTSPEPEWVRARVGVLAENPPAGWTPVVAAQSFGGTLALPGAPLASSASPKGFDPNGAALVLGDFDFVRPSENKDAADRAPKPLDDRDLQSRLNAAEVALKGYAGSYFEAWTTKVQGETKPDFGSWTEAQAAARELSENPAKWAEKLQNLETLMQKAIGIRGLASLLGDARKDDPGKWGQALGSDAVSLGNAESPVTKALPRHIKKFAELPGSAVGARNALASSTELKKEYFSDFEPKVLEGGVQGLGAWYWANARIGMLRALASSYATDSGKIVLSQEKKFPLWFDPSAVGSASLTKERLAEVMKAVSASSANAGDSTPGGWKKTEVPVIDEELEKLFKPDQFMADRPDLAKALRAWSDWFAQNPTVTIVAIDDHGYSSSRETDKLKGPEGREASIGGAIYTQLRINEQLATNRDGGKSLVKQMPVYALDAAKLQFKMDNGAALSASWSPSTPWQTLELLCQRGAEAVGDDWKTPIDPGKASKKWLVPVFFKGQDGNDYFIRVGLEFSVDVPTKMNWPTTDKWK